MTRIARLRKFSLGHRFDGYLLLLTQEDDFVEDVHYGSRRVSDTHPGSDLSCGCEGRGVGLHGCHQRERAEPLGGAGIGAVFPHSRPVEKSLSHRLGR
jgi:hypothetical protein